MRARDYTVAGCRITAILYPHKTQTIVNLPSARATPLISGLIALSHGSVSVDSYSELYIGTPHLESNQLFKCVHHEEFHSSLRFSGIWVRVSPIEGVASAPIRMYAFIAFTQRLKPMKPDPRPSRHLYAHYARWSGESRHTFSPWRHLTVY